MWTPRRLLVLFAAIAAGVGLFVGYLQTSFGRVDGLPQLPAEYLTPADASAPLPPSDTSPTIQRLQRAFGANSPEVTDSLVYKLKFEESERGLVFAMGQPEFGREASPLVKVSPCSVGFFADANKRVRHPPGEVEEVSTFHADECLLQFDRPVSGPADISKAKLLGMELVSKPGMPTADPRRGRIWVTNNQRSADPNNRLVFRTPGPLFYQSPDADPAKKPGPDAPQVWTAAGVEVVDCRNLPRPLPPGTDALPILTADALRTRGVVAAMVAGETLPPPTLVATGMKIYLKPKADDNDRRNASGYGGVRLIELATGVQINQWTDAGGGVPGGSAAAPKADLGLASPLAGGLAVAGGEARKLADRALLVIETNGPFRYDFEKGTARFDTAPGADPSRPNNVAVTRIAAAGKLDDLICKQLVVDFFGGPDKEKSGGGMAIKELTATGPDVYLSVEADGFSARGVYLNYQNQPQARTTKTVLRGSPVVAKKEQNSLEGGSATVPAEIVLTAIDPPPPAPGQKPGEKQSLVEVHGPGRMQLWDAASGAATSSASWKQALIQQKDTVGTQVQDLLKFEGGGEFRDTKADFTLTADRLWLWLAPDTRRDKKTDGTNALPQRLLATANVVSRSPELEIGMAGQPAVDQLNVWFRDGEPPAQVGRPVQPLVPTQQASGGRQPPVPATPKSLTEQTASSPGKEQGANAPRSPKSPEPPPAVAVQPEEKKPPIQLAARAVEAWVLRYPVPPDPSKKPGESPTLKYEMERSRCDDRVVVHQDPSDPTKVPRGLDITGRTLSLAQSRAGSVMVVTGTPLNNAEVHFETTTIIGPKVTIDQPNNAVAVDGAGLLRMPSRTDFGGGPQAVERPTELEVTWSREMRFEGANAHSEFLGTVKAVQTPDRGNFRPKAAVPARPVAFRPGQTPVAAPEPDDPTWSRTAVFGHRLDVDFDRPVYFSQMRREGDTGESAKLRRAVVSPVPDDEVGIAGHGLDKTVVYLEETLDRRTRKLTRAQRVECQELELLNDEQRREQTVHASGGGELRILQPGAKDDGVAPVGGASAPAAGGEEMKLTWVKFSSRMIGVDQAKLFQSATFLNGARVWQTPTDDLNLRFEPFERPARTTHITCTEKLEVTSQKLKPGDPVEQRLTATGDAEADSDDYFGTAPVIRFLQDKAVFTGDSVRQATFMQKQRGINKQNRQSAREFEYNTKTKLVQIKDATTGSFIPGGR